jgi:hypothetical protein
MFKFVSNEDMPAYEAKYGNIGIGPDAPWEITATIPLTQKADALAHMRGQHKKGNYCCIMRYSIDGEGLDSFDFDDDMPDEEFERRLQEMRGWAMLTHTAEQIDGANIEIETHLTVK